MTDSQDRFDLEALQAKAGKRAFAKGEAYHREGRVALLACEPGRVLACVSGDQDDYRTLVTGRGAAIDGDCDCPAFEDWGFCKHMVATALAANAAGDGGVPGSLDLIRRHLKAQGADALVTLIVGLAERDLVLFRRLEREAALVSDDDETLAMRLGKALDDAIAARQPVFYEEAGAWADGVHAVLDTIDGLAAGPRAGVALKLALQAIERLEEAAEQVDSEGEVDGLFERVLDIHLEACRTARVDPLTLARDLFQRETGKPYTGFHNAAERYADVLGEAGLAEYRRLAWAAWEADPEDSRVLVPTLDFFAAREGDVMLRIALRARNLSSPWDYLHLAQFCHGQGRQAEALRHAEEGLWLFEDKQPDNHLVLFAADLLAEAGRAADAAAHLWRAFSKAPTHELYERLRRLEGETVPPHAIALLQQRLDTARDLGWRSPAPLLIRILMAESMFDQAWAAVDRYGASWELKETLARATESSHTAVVRELYAARIEELVSHGGGYDQAAALLARLEPLRSRAEHLAHVGDLKERYRRRRNFMKLLG